MMQTHELHDMVRLVPTSTQSLDLMPHVIAWLETTALSHRFQMSELYDLGIEHHVHWIDVLQEDLNTVLLAWGHVMKPHYYFETTARP